MYTVQKHEWQAAFLLPFTAFSFSKDNVIEPWDEKAESTEEMPDSLLLVLSLLSRDSSLTSLKLREKPESI